tara:strand:- start:459 stop:635 length:177 start_codon:yes stop_codon:yes gene_type:complete
MNLEQEMELMMGQARKAVKKAKPRATPRKKTKKEMQTSKFARAERKRLAPKPRKLKTR